MAGIVGEELENPRWHILKTRAGFEHKARAALINAGQHACYPEVERKWRDGQGKTRSAKYPQVSGYVFAKFFAAPIWAEFRARKLITGVVTQPSDRGPVPYEAKKQDVQKFMGLPTVKAGDLARIIIGADCQIAVSVINVDASGRVFWEAETGLKGQTHQDKCERVA